MRKNSVLIFSSFGVNVRVESLDTVIVEQLRDKLPDILPAGFEIESESVESEHLFVVKSNAGRRRQGELSAAVDRTFKIIKNGETQSEDLGISELFRTLESKIRLTIAEHAPEFVFLHAGVVEYQGRAILIPGRSFSGKTSLVVELIKNGCRYLSDEYAIIDRESLVRCFPKTLSVRGIIDDYTQKEISVAEVGAEACEEPVKPGWILISKYRKGKKTFKIEKATAGEGLLACLDNSISIRRQPRLVLERLGRLADECAALKADRGDAAEFSVKFLDYLLKSL